MNKGRRQPGHVISLALLTAAGVALFFICFFLSETVFAAHPLITDDAGTQGAGHAQFEMDGAYSEDRTDGIRQDIFQLAPILTYGAADRVDIVVSPGYLMVRTKENGVWTQADGVSDTSVEVKWRFIQKKGLGIAVKPGIVFPTGDAGAGLGAGSVGYHVYLIATEEAGRFAFDQNLGYLRNNNSIGERKDLWHLSAAVEMQAAEKFRAVVNFGAQTDPDPPANRAGSFALAGGIYRFSKCLDISGGVKRGLSSPEPDIAYLLGLTFRY